MQGTIAVTDFGWYDFLSRHPELDEANFWTPSARRPFHAPPFSPFLFKLKAPHNAICGFGFFASYAHLPDWLAWECFGIGNGCATLAAMRERIARIRARIGYEARDGPDDIGCISLVRPTFFAPDEWVPQPADWPARTVTSKRYDLSHGEAARVWAACLARAAARTPPAHATSIRGPARRYGDPVLVAPRLGQGTFRIAVTEAYGRACAVTGEHSLPVLEAAHIRPFADDGPHDVRNGLLLRADLHRLFDRGYVTVTPDLHLEVSPRLRRDYHNGHTYYPLRDRPVRMPTDRAHRPAPELLRWHNEHVYRGA